MLELRNPHSVIAALEARAGDVRALELARGGGGPAWQEARRLAERLGVAVKPLEERRGVAVKRLEERRGGDGRGLGSMARVAERAPVAVEELFAGAPGRGIWLALDSIQDPQNVGAIFRIAAFFGVRGVVMAKDRAAPMSATVYDVASGGVEAVPFAVETNLHRALGAAREAGVWLLGSSEHAARSVYEVALDRPWLLVLGNEERGLRPRIAEACDELASVAPAPGAGVTSLNVASAAAVLLGALSRDGGAATR